MPAQTSFSLSFHSGFPNGHRPREPKGSLRSTPSVPLLELTQESSQACLTFQKTKKQVENDNKRSRDLQEEGYEIIRFSGTEIYHKPRQCAENIKNIILSKCKYIKDE